MKIFYFEQHPCKNYLWRLTENARFKFAITIENAGFCSKAYYTKELSNLMYRIIVKRLASECKPEKRWYKDENVACMTTVRLKRMLVALLFNDKPGVKRFKII